MNTSMCTLAGKIDNMHWQCIHVTGQNLIKLETMNLLILNYIDRMMEKVSKQAKQACLLIREFRVDRYLSKYSLMQVSSSTTFPVMSCPSGASRLILQSPPPVHQAKSQMPPSTLLTLTTPSSHTLLPKKSGFRGLGHLAQDALNTSPVSHVTEIWNNNFSLILNT